MDTSQKNTQEEQSLLKDKIFSYLRYWPWFSISLIITLILSYLFVKYSTYSYKSEATILVKDENSSPLSELSVLGDIGIGGSVNRSAFEDELEILSSKRLLRRVVDELNLTVKYAKIDVLKEREIYLDKPFEIKQILIKDTTLLKSYQFFIKPLSTHSFEFKADKEDSFRKYTFGEKVDLSGITFTAIPDVEQLKNIKNLGNQLYKIDITPSVLLINSLRYKIKITPAGKNSNVIKLTLTGENRNKSEATLNTLVSVYNNDALIKRSRVAQKTADFIDKRLDIITEELESVEAGKVTFRKKNKITDIESEGQIFLNNANEFKKKQLEIKTKLDQIASITKYLESGNFDNLLPANISLDLGISNVAISNYNELILERNDILRGSTEQNPIIIGLTKQLTEIRTNILDNFNTVRSSLLIENRGVIAQRGRIGGQLSEIPAIAKDARSIERQQSIKESLYLLLLQKGEETAISIAAATPKAEIVDYANSSPTPVFPKPQIIYLSGLIIGFLIPFGFIYTKQYLDTKIHNRIDVEKITPNISILGEIPTIDNKNSETILSNDRSVLAEAFRIVRTNLNYFLKREENNGNVIFVTSTIKGEGKTFIAYNLALTIASTGKSILLIGADIRNPQLHRYLNKSQDSLGLSEYLYDSNIQASEITNENYNDKERFDLILSGRIPPNPAELLMNSRFEELISISKGNYDYVIVDTAPTLIVTDTLLISQLADMTVYVCRADYTDKKLLEYPKELKEEKKLKNIAFAINGIKTSNFGYGSKYGYGYGYDQDKPSLYQRIKKRISSK